MKSYDKGERSVNKGFEGGGGADGAKRRAVKGGWGIGKHSNEREGCAAGFALLNLPKGKSLGRSKPETDSSNEQAH
jgi:hypothetical protein